MTPAPRSVVLRRLRRVALCCLALALIGPLAAFWAVQAHLDHQVTRVEGMLPRPADGSGPDAVPGSGPVDVLLVVTDRREPEARTASESLRAAGPGGVARDDALLLVRVPADRRAATVISFPPAAWDDRPRGAGRARATATVSGPAPAVTLVEQLTGVRADHVALLDWVALARLTDQAGGVDPRAGGPLLDGEAVLAHLGDAGASPTELVRRQQQVMSRLLQRLLSGRMWTRPWRVYRVLDVLSEHATIDREWRVGEIRDLAWSLHEIRALDIAFVTAPARRGSVPGPT